MLYNSAPSWKCPDKCCPLAGDALLTDCMQEVTVMHEGHEGVGQLPQPLLHQTRHCVDGIVFQADRMGLYRQWQKQTRLFFKHKLTTTLEWPEEKL